MTGLLPDERLMTLPLAKRDLPIACAAAFALVATARAALVAALALGAVGVHVAGSAPVAVVLRRRTP